MGLLDDAIREHLELKRLHGADATEVARQEHEALGPVVRGELATPPPASPAYADDEEELPAAPVQRERAPAEPLPPVGEPPAAPPAEPAAESTAPVVPSEAVAPPPPAPVPAPEAPADGGQPTVAFSLADLEAAEEAEASAAAAPAPPAPVQPAEPEPQPEPEPPVQDLEWDAPATPAPEPDPTPVAHDVVPADEEHDELEETPEFLQETPEHDRLWFEQKPPKDFDF